MFKIQNLRHIKLYKFKNAHRLFCDSANIFINPYEILSKDIVVQLLRKNDILFKPSLNEMEAARSLILKSDPKFLCATHDPKKFPKHEMPEVAFLGRSNVGKSSLIKALIENKAFVKVSKNPGHTKSVNFYQIGSFFTLIDNPGYGFNQPKYYSSSLEGLLTGRKNLRRTFLLIDASVGLTDGDEMMLHAINSLKIPNAIVITKIDKVKSHQLLQIFLYLRRRHDIIESPYYYPQPFLVSAHSGIGIGLFTAYIASITNVIHESKNIMASTKISFSDDLM